MYNTILYNVEGGIATITMNRTEVFNAFNDEMTFELQAVFKEVAKDTAVRVVVLTGAGKAFCSGQDLKAAMAAENRSFSESIKTRYNPLILAMRNLPKPIVCRLNGVAAGAGCSLALACDYIVASEDASLIEVFINIGLVLDSGSSYFLPKMLGSLKAFELASMGTKVKGKEAQELGLVNKAVPADQLDAAVKEVTDYYVSAPTKSIGLIKKMIYKALSSDLETMLQYEAYCQDIAGSSGDYKEGVGAFLEKRKAVFKGE
jgi:2-(1,2-epoxy-1,2-dihydrophenyl)acetyl-CoA isomerase